MFVLIAAPLASNIPLAALAGVLIVVAWNICEREEIIALLRDWRTGIVLAVTFALTIIEDLTAGIVAGGALADLMWLLRRRKGAAGWF